MKNTPLMCALLLFTNGCAPNSVSNMGGPVSVSVADVIANPDQYSEEELQVTGYLVMVGNGVQLLSPRWLQCYGPEPEREYVTTTLPESVLGEKMPGQWYSAFEGNLVSVRGVFTASSRPWPDSPIMASPKYRAAGPLREAHITSIGQEKCGLQIGR